MLSLLVKKQMSEIFRSYFYDYRKNKPRSKTSTILLILLFVFLLGGLFGGMFLSLSYSLCHPLVSQGLDWLYFLFMGIIAILLGSFGGVFNTYSSLYLAKDNDLLLSMPIPPKTILLSKLLGVYFIGLMYSGVVIVPSIIIYLIFGNCTINSIIGCIFLLLIVSLVVLSLCCGLGYVVAKISSKLKFKSFLAVIAFLAFMAVYYLIAFKAEVIFAELISNGSVIAEAIKTYGYPFYMFGEIGVGNYLFIFIESMIVGGIFLLIWFILKHSFIKVATTKASYSYKRQTKGYVYKTKSELSGLLNKEFGKFVSSPNYMLNCGIGLLFLVIAGVMLFIKGDFLVEAFNQIVPNNLTFAQMIITVTFLFILTMVDIVAPSFSLEGNKFYILKTLPVKKEKIILAKLLVQLILCSVPLLFVSTSLLIPFSLNVIDVIFAFLIMCSFELFMALLGLVLGLKYVNLNWMNEIIPIKQSACVGLTLLFGVLYIVVIGSSLVGLSYFVNNYLIISCIFIVNNLLFSGLLYLWIKKKADKIIEGL